MTRHGNRQTITSTKLLLFKEKKKWRKRNSSKSKQSSISKRSSFFVHSLSREMRYVRCPAGGVFSSAAASAGGEAHQFINKRYRTRSPQLKQVKSVGKRPGRGGGSGLWCHQWYHNESETTIGLDWRRKTKWRRTRKKKKKVEIRRDVCGLLKRFYVLFAF